MGVNTITKFDKIVWPAAEFTQLTNSDHNAGITSAVERPAGHLHPMFVWNQTQEPLINFTTQQISTVLANVPVSGAVLGASQAYYKLATETGSVARANLSHSRLVIQESLAYWTNITLPHNGSGEIQVVMAANYDGTNDPFVHAGGVALPGNLTVTELFGCGPVGINGTALPAIQNIEVASGVTLMRVGGDSEEFDTFIATETTDPIVTVQLKEAVNWNTLGLRGLELDGIKGFEFFARKYKNKSSRVANATAQHIHGQATHGQVVPINVTGQGSSSSSDSFRVQCVSNTDALLPLIFTPNQAITAF